jgi:hypothetical protein
MDRQVVIRPHGELFHVVFHNYMGPHEGRQIGEWLDLEEIGSPEEDIGVGPLKRGQFYLWHAMDRHPDLHALIGGGRLEKMAQAVDHFHVRVLKGNRFLPEVPPEHPEAEATDTSYIEYLEEEHKPLWCKGPRAILQAVFMGAVPTVILVLAFMILFRHFGDHREEVGLDEVFRRASLATVQQSTLARIWDPDHSHELRTRINAVRYIEGEMVVLADGNVLEFAGMGEARPVLEAARTAGVTPRIELEIEDHRAVISGILIGDRVFGKGVELTRVMRLPRTADVPDRTRSAGNAEWYQPDRLPLGDTGAMRALVDKRICLRGILHDRDGVLELHCMDGEVFYVQPVQASSSMDQFFEFFADGDTELKVDLVLTEVFRTGKQEQSGVIGSAELYSISAQNYHIVAAR